MMRNLDIKRLISMKHFGFREIKSVQNSMRVFTGHWHDALNIKNEAVAMALDTAKKIDKVWHSSSLVKLESFRINYWSISLFENGQTSLYHKTCRHDTAVERNWPNPVEPIFQRSSGSILLTYAFPDNCSIQISGTSTSMRKTLKILNHTLKYIRRWRETRQVALAPHETQVLHVITHKLSNLGLLVGCTHRIHKKI